MKAYHLILYFLVLQVIACKKETDWLDEKPDKALLVPQTLTDFRALLNNESKFNVQDNTMGMISGEPYYVRETVWTTLANGLQKNLYTWNVSPYEGGLVPDWNNPYSHVYYCNVVLDGLKKIEVTPSNKTNYNEVLGTTLFFKSFAYFKLLSTFASVYDTSTAANNPGIILLETADVSAKRQRASVEESYQATINGLMAADSLLPAFVAVNSAPNKAAAKALLARVFLAMRQYERAFAYADKVVGTSPALLDYNTLVATATFPFPKANPEDIFHSRMGSYTVLSNATIDSNLYKSYATNDLRRTLFFNTATGFPAFKGSYEGASANYSGLAMDEMLLIRAETNARAGRTAAAMNDLNTLLIKRYRTGSYSAMTASSGQDALVKVLAERKKELLFRGLMWTDLKRLNTEAALATTLTRTIAGQTYTLAPGELRYVFLLPDSEILLSGVEQNPR